MPTAYTKSSEDNIYVHTQAHWLDLDENIEKLRVQNKLTLPDMVVISSILEAETGGSLQVQDQHKLHIQY